MEEVFENQEVEEVLPEINEKELKALLSKSDSEMIKEMLEHNQLSFMVLSGKLTVSPNNEFLGYFRDIVSSEGDRIHYPNGKIVDSIFIYNPKDLEEGHRYYFDCELAKIDERKKQRNPFLLQTSNTKVQRGESIRNIEQAIKEKVGHIKEIEEQKLAKVNEANEIIENYNRTIIEKENLIAEKDELVTDLSLKIEEGNIQLKEITGFKSEIEDTIDSLKLRVSLCKSLGFLSKKDEDKYLSILKENQFDINNYLNFEDDLSSDFTQLAEHIHHYLYHKKNLIYTKFQIKNFLTLLRSHDLVVLSGLSGSGKTQIIKAFAEALGGVAKIIPVKPNWTSSDDLIGYYNPIQMSFMPTPFTEAIVEAIQNPHQLYFICLDEMNLARVEYYFADFLSKLEERNTEPEIELYAKHEEELFVSEFITLLNLIETSIDGIEINSWQDFLNNTEARKGFFEMLGNSDKESLLQLHSKMKRRLIDVLKFPSTIRIPNNVRFIGAINVDETTHYFSPKILDRVHIVKFDNPLLYEDSVNNYFTSSGYDCELKPVHIRPEAFSNRSEYPKMNESDYIRITESLKEINKNYLLPLNIDFGVRSIRQSLNYARYGQDIFEYATYDEGDPKQPVVRPYIKTVADNYIKNVDTDQLVLNTILAQKILPRFQFDGNEITRSGKTKLEILNEMYTHLESILGNIKEQYNTSDFELGKASTELLADLIRQAETSSQVNYFA
jgi:hypothetical protein